MKTCFSILLLLLIVSCTQTKRNIVDEAEVNQFLDSTAGMKTKEQALANLEFWDSRVSRRNRYFTDLLQAAKAHLQLFGLSGEVHNLHAADSLFRESSAQLGDKDSELLLAIAQTSISRHQFREAFNYLNKSATVGEESYAHRLVSFDTDMELGRFRDAQSKLHSISGIDNFDYLLRKAKLSDHQGNMDDAIKAMEKAAEEVKHNKASYCWALSNMADMYGHGGLVEKSYQTYLKVLHLDPNYLYALKGIAWIAYSHDNNPQEAKRILHYILRQRTMPDIYLFLSEIAEWEGNADGKDRMDKQFIGTVSSPAYGNMYNKYLIALLAESPLTLPKAMELAKLEIDSRSTPETWSWYAWVLYRQGNTQEAWTIMNNHVINRTFEPEVLYRLGQVLIASGQLEQGRKMLQECLESKFELGPVIVKDIRALLKKSTFPVTQD